MTTDTRAFEDRVMKMIHDAVEEYRIVFDQISIFPQADISRHGTSDSKAGYQSEACVIFWDSGDVFDIIEFHIIWNGKPAVKEQQIELWLHKTINEIIETRKKTMQ